MHEEATLCGSDRVLTNTKRKNQLWLVRSCDYGNELLVSVKRGERVD